MGVISEKWQSKDLQKFSSIKTMRKLAKTVRSTFLELWKLVKDFPQSRECIEEIQQNISKNSKICEV